MTPDLKSPGDTVEGFRILSEIGRGAASVIYLAQELKTKRVYALKHVAKRDPKEQRFIDQAEEEYKVASKLKHPRIRRIERVIRKKESIFSSSVSDLYLVMQHIDGISCEQSPPQTFEDACWIFEQVADALAYMNTKGFVHADMKPNNIIINEKKDAYIIDLGQSCVSGTIKQRIQGTPDYIAPEQVHRRAITPKTDTYNLGAAMYWILTRHKVPNALPKEDSLVSRIDDHLIEKPRATIEINPRVPQMLDQIVMECVERNPDDRPDLRTVADRVNLLRAKLEAAQILRKSGIPDTTTRNNGERPAPTPPPVDPGPGIDD